MENRFNLKKLGTDIKTEVVAGLTTFLTMAYIIVVNPAILSTAGVPFDQVFMATIVSAVIGTLIMAFFANYPIAIAPGMGMNAYFTSIVATQQVSYEAVFGAIFLAGILFLIITFTSLREMIIESIPAPIKYGITAGIGLFIAFIGLRMSGIVVSNRETLVTLGDLSEPVTILAIFGLLATLILITLNIKGALFIGMLLTAFIGYIMGMFEIDGIVSVPKQIDLFMIDVGGVFSASLYGVVFTFLLVTIFDTTGTMIGVAEQAGLMKDGKLPRAKSALVADAIATTVGATLGTTPSTAYIESSSGVAAGGRSGLTAFVVGVLFIVALFFSPIVGAISSLPAITAPALIIVGCYMMGGLAKINWKEFTEAFPAFLVILTMPLTASISTGIAVGFITYPLLKIVRGKRKEVHPILFLLAILFLIQFIFFT